MLPVTSRVRKTEPVFFGGETCQKLDLKDEFSGFFPLAVPEYLPAQQGLVDFGNSCVFSHVSFACYGQVEQKGKKLGDWNDWCVCPPGEFFLLFLFSSFFLLLSLLFFLVLFLFLSLLLLLLLRRWRVCGAA